MIYKRKDESKPFPYHNKGCPLEWEKPAIYCEACKGGNSQMDMFSTAEEKKEARKLDPELADAEEACTVSAGVPSRIPKMKKAKEPEVQEEAWVNEFPERSLPIPTCIRCKQPYPEVRWIDEQTVQGRCRPCGDRSKQKCPKSFIKAGYKHARSK